MFDEPPAIALLHSPLTTSAAWGQLPTLIREAGFVVASNDVRDNVVPPFAAHYVGRTALQLRDALGTGPALLVAHSGAGPLVASVSLARHALGAAVTGYLFFDAGLPQQVRSRSRLEVLQSEAPDVAADLARALARGESFPNWTDDDLRDDLPDPASRRLVLDNLCPRPDGYWTEPLPLPADWPDAPCGYVRTSAGYDDGERVAQQRGWPTAHADLGHFAAVAHPHRSTELVLDMVSRLT